MEVKFPEGFFFGAATAAHQVEGGNTNDWTAWEDENAERLVTQAKENPPRGGWAPHILGSSPNPIERENYISGKATDHYHRFEQDFSLAKELGHNAHRFSLEWSRIEPEDGKFNPKELGHYRNVILFLKKNNIEPFVTLWHWTIPQWLAKKGGITARRFPFYFERYVGRVMEIFGKDVKYWITLNEPEIYSLNTRLTGKWPPMKKSIFACRNSMHSLIRAHNRAYSLLKEYLPSSQVGPVCNLTYFEPAKGATNHITKAFLERYWNHYFLKSIMPRADFIGLNYYFHNRIDGKLNTQTATPASDMGWELYPTGIKQVLRSLRAYRKPIYITENGLADSRDLHRGWFIKQTLKAVYEAIKEGIIVKGYFHWSLLDNFEWDKGFWPRFGLIEVDYKTLERKIRPSAFIYKSIIEGNYTKQVRGIRRRFFSLK